MSVKAEQQKKRRAAETAEEAEERRRKDRERRATETAEKAEERRRKDRERQQKKRSAPETVEEAEERRKKERERKQAARKRLSVEDKEQIKNENRLAHIIQRANLSEEAKVQIREKNADGHREMRDRQSDETKKDTQDKNTAAHRKVRQEQSSQQRAVCNSKRRIGSAKADLTPLPPQVHYLGKMTEECSHCGALYFLGEQVRHPNGTYHPCCENGSVTLDKFERYPAQLAELFTGMHPESDNFLANARNFNSALSIASMDCNLKNLPGRGPHVIKVHGQILYQASSAIPRPNAAPAYGQLFFIDETSAANHRLSHQANQKCSESLMRFLSRFIRQNHEYAQGFKMLSEVYKEEEEKAKSQNRTMEKVRLVFKTKDTPDPRRYNASVIPEVAVVYVGEDNELPSPRSYTIHARQGGLQKIPIINQMLDPCTYPLYFIKGDFGWHPGRQKQIVGPNGNIAFKKLSQRQYYKYYISIRDSFNPIHFGKRLFQQFLVGSWANTEQMQLDWIKNPENQKKLRAENYADLRDYIADGAAGQCGKRIVLPATYTSSPIYMVAYYMDAMAITGRYGKPDLFTTYTCNPNWIEIKENLYHDQSPSDRADLIARVFRMKVNEFKKDIIDRACLGKVIAYIYTVEWQKRGLPHIHLLITLAEEDKPRTSADVDRLICAELPNPYNVELFNKVTTHMIHRDCQIGARCWQDGKCKKQFPKVFTQNTDMDKDGYPSYRRRNNGIQTIIGRGNNEKEYDNRWIVPYNPYLLMKFDAHINLEICSMIHAVKYLFKYVYKGPDRAQLTLRQEAQENGIKDEVQEHLDARYICPPEAFHRLFSFDLDGRSNAVIELALHEENQHTVVFEVGKEKDASENAKDSTLMAFFKFNKWAEELEQQNRLNELPIDPKTRLPIDPRTVPYHRFPEHFTFTTEKDDNGKIVRRWKQKGKTTNNIGRVYSATVKQIERYCIRLLLFETTGATSFQSLFTVNGQQFPSAFEAAKERGLIQTTDHFDQAVKDAAFFRMPHALRCVFVALLAFDEPTSAQEMWTKWKGNMSEDFIRKGRTPIEAEALAYYELLEMSSMQNIKLEMLINDKYAKPKPMADIEPDYKAIGDDMYMKLNQNQKVAVDAVLTGQEKYIFLDGPGGSGKTFCYECIFNKMRGNGKKVACVAWTGIAANLLPGGRTICSFFKINTSSNYTSSLKPNTAEGKTIKELEAIIIDECSMISSDILKSIDNALRDIMNQPDEPFGGKTVLMGGDFRQVLPIPDKPYGDGFLCSLKQCPLFSNFKKFELNENMRAHGESDDFKKLLLAIGEDKLPKDLEERIEIPTSMLSQGDLVQEVFEGVLDDPDHLSKRAILCAKNANVDQMNTQILERMNGHKKRFSSADLIVKDSEDDSLQLPIEVVNSLAPSGLPPHHLELKIGAVVMLTRNLNVKEGLCNGTRLQVLQFSRNNAIKCGFINGARKGQPVIIPRIDLLSTKGKGISFVLKRRQFPLKLAFAMTINKSQGQSLEKVGVSLIEEVFSHGQLYVAMSRARKMEGIKLELANGSTRTANVVDKRAIN